MGSLSSLFRTFHSQVNTEMVRAILDGRKSVTRRVVKHDTNEILNSPYHKKHPEVEDKQIISKLCMPPYQPEDVLYVRETWCLRYDGEKYFYKADKNTQLEEKQLVDYDHVSWKASIHMPKEAARIWLKVKGVRVERWQDITDEQAEKEGCNDYTSTALGFSYLWDSTIKRTEIDRYGWDANPWVWVIDFEQCEKPEEFYR